jgi:photosystem II stability/assembly factor-like uncharacterized protein
MNAFALFNVRWCAVVALAVAAVVASSAQSPPVAAAIAAEVWQMQISGSAASLRGIFSVDGNVAWASGSQGTVLRTLDGGQHWLACATPDGAKDGSTLDFRGVQAWDADTAIVMASGPGDKSRLYKTTNGCGTWRLIAQNKDTDGFWDALVSPRATYGDVKLPGYAFLLGDPIHGHFDMRDGTVLGPGIDWEPSLAPCAAKQGEAIFAASNSSVNVSAFESFILGTGGLTGARVILSPGQLRYLHIARKECLDVEVPIAGGTESAGVFSLSFRDATTAYNGVAVGGDYLKPTEPRGTAARTEDGGLHWTASEKPPHGYRSTVQWFNAEKLWITAGTNGSDFSTDDGRTWHPLDDGNWNALSLPFLVGPKGRIARIDAGALRARVKALKP